LCNLEFPTLYFVHIIHRGLRMEHVTTIDKQYHVQNNTALFNSSLSIYTRNLHRRQSCHLAKTTLLLNTGRRRTRHNILRFHISNAEYAPNITLNQDQDVHIPHFLYLLLSPITLNPKHHANLTRHTHTPRRRERYLGTA
jgi:hypothetical protein